MDDYERFYNRLSAPLRDRPRLVRALATLDKALVVLVAAAYVGSCLWMLATHDPRLASQLLVPAAALACMSALRAWIDAPRPYEAHAIDPLIKKDTSGKSFPGRHVFSATVIAFALGRLSIALGAAGLIAACAIACVRVLGGVHYPRDVVAGALLGLACALISFTITGW